MPKQHLLLFDQSEFRIQVTKWDHLPMGLTIHFKDEKILLDNVSKRECPDFRRARAREFAVRL